MKYVYINVSTTEYNNGITPPRYELWEQVDGGELTCRKLSWQEARRLQWELKKAGATHEYSANPYHPAISYSETAYFARH